MADDTNKGSDLDSKLEAFKNDMLAALNSGMSAREKRYDEKIEKTLKGQAEALTKTLGEQISKLAPVGDDPPEPDGKPGKGGKSKDPDAMKLRGLEQQLADLKAESEKTKAERDAERRANRDVSKRSKIADALAKVGVADAARAKIATRYLESEGRIDYEADDSDQLVWIGENGDRMPFDTGLKSWAKTEEIKIFLPPAGTRGAGGRPVGSPPPSSDPNASKDAVWTTFGEALRNGR